MSATQMSAMVPNYMPAPMAFVLLTGALLVAAALCMYLGKYDKLAAAVLAVYMLIIILTIHIPGAMPGSPTSQASLFMLLKDMGLMGAAMQYASHMAKDRAVLGE